MKNQWVAIGDDEPENNSHVDVMDLTRLTPEVMCDVLYLNDEWLDHNGEPIVITPSMWRKV